MSKVSSLFGGSSSNNDAIVAEQKRQAEEAAKKERERQARLGYGKKLLDAIYEGGQVGGAPLLEDAAFDPNQTYYTSGGQKFTPTPQERKEVYTPPQTIGKQVRDGGRGDGKRWVTQTIPGKTEVQTVGDTPEEQFQQKLAAGELSGSTPKEYEGIGDEFYEGFKKSVTDYYLPQLEDRYEDAQSQDLFALARQGILRSSEAADRQGDRLTQKLDQEAAIKNDADAQAAGLKKKVATAKSNALQQLYQTEDPTAAANNALTEVNAVQSSAPQLSPLGDIFGTAALAYQNYNKAKEAQKLNSIVAPKNPYAGSGKIVG